MALLDFLDRMSGLYIASELNALTDSKTGKPIAMFSLKDMIYVNEEISPTEYENLNKFIKKLINKEPLIKIGRENKTEITEDDFIYYWYKNKDTIED